MAHLGSHPPGDGTTVVSVIDTKVFDIKLFATWRGDYEHDSSTPAASLGVASFSPARSEYQEHFLQFLHETVAKVTDGFVLLGEDGRAAVFDSKPRDPPPGKRHLRLLSGDQPYFRALEAAFAEHLAYTLQQDLLPASSLIPSQGLAPSPNPNLVPVSIPYTSLNLTPDPNPNR